ncbi:HNH endonuclease signature motif containing protein [Aspergillus homomorphus CBS 101889]|uniref:HNH nuclease domain-containing protein n=1 Tax=Aspergillus homomorphus (strain CBS 101889) TaxID=1450537 RepID=A0A395HJR9_ASPHC|nr:hypothetical protein BO97DRAFT_439109 [Aspergillus homomorphus CBS 101889]RAL06504.1 hypothetical protein BO97DRAFT_439109 [Aspergillus homomorphus CBS 101889]
MAQHQTSLETVLDFSPVFLLPPHQKQHAQVLLNTCIQHYGLEQSVQSGYKPARLVHEMFSSDDVSIASALSYIENCIGGSCAHSGGLAHINVAIEKFAEYIVDNFLLPLRASSAKTPQATPTALSLSQTPAPIGTRQRLSILRKSCLLRDHYRCVISRKFDTVEARRRNEKYGDMCEDNDGNLLRDESDGGFGFQHLEVAHILPHCLATMGPGESELSESKMNVLRILDMFDPGLSHRIDGPNIDSPTNALTLTLDYHRLFGEFQLLFEPTGKPLEYRIDSLESSFLRDPIFPVTRELTLSPNHTVSPPDPRLLRVHSAIAHITPNGAGDHIERILRDIEEVDVKADGSTNLGYLAGLRLNGWLSTLAVF